MKTGKRVLTNLLRVLSCAMVFLAAACAGDNTVSKIAPPSASNSSRSAVKDPAAPAPQVRRSLFTLDSSSRDPFNPQAKKTVAIVSSNPSSQAVSDLPALLTANFQGVGGTIDHRIAMINNVLLETGRSTVIPLRVGAENRKFAVKCKEVGRTSVVLEVEGYGSVTVRVKTL